MKNKFILAHRGYQEFALENSVDAFFSAFNTSFDGVELDIRLTKDKKIVIWHDKDLSKLGFSNIKIKNANFKDIERISCEIKLNENYSHIRLISLERFLDMFLLKFKYINIEIKYVNRKTSKILIKLLNSLLISKYWNFIDKLIISSFNFWTIKKLKKLNSKIKVGLLLDKKRSINLFNRKAIISTCDFLHPSHQLFFRHTLFYENFKLPLNVYTVTDDKTYNKCILNPNIFLIIGDKNFNQKN